MWFRGYEWVWKYQKWFFSSVICIICESELKICIVCVCTCGAWMEWMEMRQLTRGSPTPESLSWTCDKPLSNYSNCTLQYGFDYGHAPNYALTVTIWGDSDFK